MMDIECVARGYLEGRAELGHAVGPKRVSRLTGLAFDSHYLETYVKPDAYGKGVESRTALYKDSVLFPYQRLINQTIPRGKGFGEWSYYLYNTYTKGN